MAAALLGAPAHADESPFVGIYTTDTLPAGGKEIEQWLIGEHGRPFESWDHVGGRTEFEYGVTDAFQISLYANYDWTRIQPHNALAGDDALDAAKFTSVSSEAIYKVTDPYTHPLGFALYLEPAYGSDFREVEAKVLLDSHFLDDRLILAANPVLEYEWEREAIGWHKGTELQFLAGLSYRFAANWFGGIEFAAKRELDGIAFWQASDPAADSYSIGPTLHYAKDNWWATLGVQAQLPWAANLSGEANETVGGFAHEEPRYRLGTRFGIEL